MRTADKAVAIGCAIATAFLIGLVSGEARADVLADMPNRDANAAANILAVGQTVSAHGGTVRRSRATASERKSLRSANLQGVNRA